MSGQNKFILRAEGEKAYIEKILNEVDGVEEAKHSVSEDNEHEFIIVAKNGADIRKSVFKRLANSDATVLMFKAFDMTLEDIFITLTNKAKEESKNESNN